MTELVCVYDHKTGICTILDLESESKEIYSKIECDSKDIVKVMEEQFSGINIRGIFEIEDDDYIDGYYEGIRPGDLWPEGLTRNKNK